MLETNINPIYNNDLKVYYWGEEECDAGHPFGPAVRSEFLIHYIIRGKGFYKVNDKKYELREGDGFLIWPNDVTYYEADKKDPWYYMWIGFNGTNAKRLIEKAGLSKEIKIFSYQEDNKIVKYFKEMNHVDIYNRGKEEIITGLLYLFLGTLIENNKLEKSSPDSIHMQDIYLKEALEYIQNNYFNNISVNKIAEYLGIDRSYIYAIFKSKLNISPQQYLINLRLDKACGLLENTNLSIGNIARSVGYKDPLTFSKVFKKKYAASPKKYRNSK